MLVESLGNPWRLIICVTLIRPWLSIVTYSTIRRADPLSIWCTWIQVYWCQSLSCINSRYQTLDLCMPSCTRNCTGLLTSQLTKMLKFCSSVDIMTKSHILALVDVWAVASLAAARFATVAFKCLNLYLWLMLESPQWRPCKSPPYTNEGVLVLGEDCDLRPWRDRPNLMAMMQLDAVIKHTSTSGLLQ